MPAPNPPDDIVERAIAGVFAVIDGNADIAAITERASDNVTAWNANMASLLPVIAYRVVIATQTGSPQDTRHAMFVFSAIAPRESDANAMLGVLDRKIKWAPALAALAPPIGPVNGYMFNPVRRAVDFDSDEDVTRVDLEMTLEITVPIAA